MKTTNLNYYNKHIKKCKSKKYKKGTYLEKHHILPRSLGGNNDKTNIISLSIEDHILAHYFLWKDSYKSESFTEKEKKSIVYALKMMLDVHNLTVYYSLDKKLKKLIKEKSKIKEDYFKLNKGKLHHLYGTKMSPERKKAVSERFKGKRRSKESIEKMRKKLIGRNISDEFKKRVGDYHRGKKDSKDTRLKKSVARLGEKNPSWGKKGENSNTFKGWYYTPWGKFASYSELTVYLNNNAHIKISDRTIFKYCKDNEYKGTYKYVPYRKRRFWFKEKGERKWLNTFILLAIYKLDQIWSFIMNQEKHIWNGK